jgi:hypothetical protein
VGGSQLQVSLSKKNLGDSISMEKNLGMVVDPCHLSNGGNVMGLHSGLAWAKIETPPSPNNQGEKSWRQG